MRFAFTSLLLPVGAALAVALSGCGGGNAPEAIGTPLSRALPAPAEDLCFKGRNDTATGAYVSVDGVCTKVFAPMAAPVAAGEPPAGAAASAPAAGQPLRAPHARFTWGTLLSWAAATYPQFFSGSFQDGVLGDYTYRYWPATGHYIGLRNGEQLYVLGPATDDEILYIGTLGSLLCFVYPDNCASGTGSTTTGGTTGGSTGSTASGSDIAGNASTTAAIVSTTPYSSTIDVLGDEDWFAVNLVAGTAYTFYLEGAPTGKGTLADPYLKLYSSTSQLLAYNDDVAYPANLNARLVYTPSTSGRYFVSASGYSSIGTYQLTASAGGGTGGATGTGTGSGSTGTGSTGTGSTGTGSTGSTVRLTSSSAGQGEGTVTPASASYARGTHVTATAQPEFFSEFMGWTSNSAGCIGMTVGCEIIMNADSRMEARFEPVVYESSFDTSYPTTYSGHCVWQVSWTNTRLELRYAKSGGQYVGRLRVVGTRRAVATRTLSSSTTCNGSSNNIDQTFTLGAWGGVGSGASGRVRTFDGEGDEYLTLATGGLPGPAIGGGNGAIGFLPIELRLDYTGTSRSGSTQVFSILSRVVR